MLGIPTIDGTTTINLTLPMRKLLSMLKANISLYRRAGENTSLSCQGVIAKSPVFNYGALIEV
jgi:hypothetical protein